MREYKALQGVLLKQIEDRTVTGLFSVMGNVDAGDDRVWPGAFLKTIAERFKASNQVKHLWQHDMWSPPIAVVKDLYEVGKDDLPPALKNRDDVTGAAVVVRQYLPGTRATEILDGIAHDAITEMSFAYDAMKFSFEEDEDSGRTIRNLTELRLWETSDVNWGMNDLTVASKAIPALDTGLLWDRHWSAPKLADFREEDDDLWGELPDDEKRRIASHFAYDASGTLAKFEDLRFPHHAPSTTGIGQISKQGVQSAMLSLLMADFAPVDFSKVYEHLRIHHSQFGIEPPPKELALMLNVMAGVSSMNLDEKTTGLLSVTRLDLLRTFAPPGSREKTTISDALRLRLAIAERALV